MSFRTVLVPLGSLLLVAGSATVYFASQEPGPLITIRQPSVVGGLSFSVDVSVDAHQRGIAPVEAWIDQEGRRYPVLKFPGAGDAKVTQETPERVRFTQTVVTGSLGTLRDGKARLVVVASRPVLFGLRDARTEVGRDLDVRLTPPVLSVLSSQHYITLGGAELIVYRVTPPDVVSGVTVGDRFYRGYPASGVAGSRIADPAVHVAFFALGFDQDVGTPIRLTARDAAGNSAVAEFEHQTFSTTFSASRVPVDDRFIARVVPGILASTPGLSLATGTPEERLQAFLHVNGELRRQNAEQIEKLAGETSPDWLARGAFRRLAGAKSEAPFAEHRTYLYDGVEIDQQVHLGFDLASTRGAAVAVSNSGRVVFAGHLGIYGNCAVVDHGMGVQSLYAHLTSMDVEPGDRVEKDETIGRSGMTGLAGGDHVHFTVLVGGTPVNPIEWWDPHWIRDRVERKLREAQIRD